MPQVHSTAFDSKQLSTHGDILRKRAKAAKQQGEELQHKVCQYHLGLEPLRVGRLSFSCRRYIVSVCGTMDHNAQQSAQVYSKCTNLVMQDRHLRMASNAQARTKHEPFCDRLPCKW